MVIEKYWMTQSGYFRLAPTVELGMGITDGKLRFFHGISRDSQYNTISTKCYNERTFYDFLNNPFKDNSCIPAINIPPITIDDRSRPHKGARYTPDLLPVSMSVASENYVSTFTTPYYLAQIFLLPSDGYNPPHVIIKDEPFL